MALSTMYTGKNNSPQTDITAAIQASDTVIAVSDILAFPDAPNLATIGTDENAEVIRYNGISGSTLTGCERGFGGTTASQWDAGTVISRQITKYDIDTLQGNIRELNTAKANSADVYTQTEIDTALAEKAPLASPALTGTPTAPTASSGTSTTQIATTAYVRGEVSKEILYFYQRSVSVATSATIMTITDSRITANTVVLECTFANPANITSNVTWTSSAGSITFSGTCTAATTANVTLGQKGN